MKTTVLEASEVNYVSVMNCTERSGVVSGYPPSPETLGVLEPVGDLSTSLLYIR